MTHKKATTSDEAWNIQETYSGKPHGWIQWKGTEVCMDVHCKCGKLFHIDAGFAYHVKCPSCSSVYMCNGHIELIELEQEPDSCVVSADEIDDSSESDTGGIKVSLADPSILEGPVVGYDIDPKTSTTSTESNLLMNKITNKIIDNLQLIVTDKYIGPSYEHGLRIFKTDIEELKSGCTLYFMECGMAGHPLKDDEVCVVHVSPGGYEKSFLVSREGMDTQDRELYILKLLSFIGD